MEEKLQLKAQTRVEEAKKNNKIRKSGEIPAILYGHGIKNTKVKISQIDFIKIYKIAKESSLIDLIIDDQKPVKVIIQDVQYEEISDKILHVDFYQVNMDEKITAEINLIFEGIAPAIKELGGILVKNHNTIKIKCLPTDLIKEYKIDISTLKTFTDNIYAKDLKLSSKVELLTEPNVILVHVAPPRSEEELKSLDAEVKEDVSKVDAVEKKEPKEEDEKTDDKKNTGAKPAANKEKK